MAGHTRATQKWGGRGGREREKERERKKKGRREEAREIAKEKAHKGDTNCGVPCSAIGDEEEECDFRKRGGGGGGGAKQGGGAGMMSHECWVSGRRGLKEVMEWVDPLKKKESE